MLYEYECTKCQTTWQGNTKTCVCGSNACYEKLISIEESDSSSCSSSDTATKKPALVYRFITRNEQLQAEQEKKKVEHNDKIFHIILILSLVLCLGGFFIFYMNKYN